MSIGLQVSEIAKPARASQPLPKALRVESHGLPVDE